MFEQQMSQSIEAGAPDITYSGNEGPKSPQQEQMMQQQMMEQQMMMQEQQMMAPVDYSSPAFKIKLIEQLMYDEGLDLGAATKKAEWIIRNKLKPRQGAAFGGIMGLDGRKQYGLGSRLRKLIPNEIAKVAEVAAPFVAPFNPLAAGLMSGIGGFDRTGKIGSSIKSGLMNYGMGQAGRYLGGADFQGGFDPRGGFTPGTAGTGKFSKYFSKPTGDGGIKNLFNKGTTSPNIERISGGDYGQFAEPSNIVDEVSLTNKIASKGYQEAPKNFLGKTIDKIGEYGTSALNYAKKHPYQAIMAASAIGGLMSMNQDDVVDEIINRGEGLDIAGIRAEVTEAFKDSSGQKLAALRAKYPYLGTQASKNTAIMANGGRIGFNNGGGFSENDLYLLKKFKYDPKEVATHKDGGRDLINSLKTVGFNMGGRIRRAEGGLMSLGGMELDYRAKGGFVPIGAREKADDVPARLSVNEFVFTADAVRSAGGGDIDKGAEIMERVMKNLEQGGQISEETQGLQGAREMFQTSQRLGEVI